MLKRCGAWPVPVSNAGAWLLVAVLLLRAPSRGPHRSRRRTAPAQLFGSIRGWWRCLPLPWRRTSEPDLGLVLTEVASRLRAGAPTELAWTAALRRAGLRAATGAGARVEDAAGVPRAVTELVERPSTDPAVRASLLVVRAACRLTHQVGAPLAQVLDQCAQSITEAREAHDARRVAMAGPAATARILAVLPLFGLVLGMGLGADPVTVALDGGWGSLSVFVGLLLVAVGRWWSISLVTSAQAAGETSEPSAPVPLGRPVAGRQQ